MQGCLLMGSLSPTATFLMVSLVSLPPLPSPALGWPRWRCGCRPRQRPRCRAAIPAAGWNPRPRPDGHEPDRAPGGGAACVTRCHALFTSAVFARRKHRSARRGAREQRADTRHTSRARRPPARSRPAAVESPHRAISTSKSEMCHIAGAKIRDGGGCSRWRAVRRQRSNGDWWSRARSGCLARSARRSNNSSNSSNSSYSSSALSRYHERNI